MTVMLVKLHMPWSGLLMAACCVFLLAPMAGCQRLPQIGAAPPLLVKGLSLPPGAVVVSNSLDETVVKLDRRGGRTGLIRRERSVIFNDPAGWTAVDSQLGTALEQLGLERQRLPKPDSQDNDYLPGNYSKFEDPGGRFNVALMDAQSYADPQMVQIMGNLGQYMLMIEERIP